MNPMHMTNSRSLFHKLPRPDVGTLWLLGWLALAAWFGFGRDWFQHNPAPAQASVHSSASRAALAAGQGRLGSTRPKANTTRLATAGIEAVQIGQMKVGDQVPAENPTGEKDTAFGDTVDPRTWRKLTLLARKTDGSFADVQLLRPLVWLEEQQAETGGTVEVHVPECGIEGRAKVVSIESCPPIQHDPNFRIVTGTFKHQAAQVLDIYIEGDDEPIGTTPNHPFWSEDRQTFVRADELKKGEHLKAFNGTPIVRRVVPLADPEPVFNLEVQCDHVYHVAKNGVLVHNSTPCPIVLFHGTTASSATSVIEGIRPIGLGDGVFHMTTSSADAARWARSAGPNARVVQIAVDPDTYFSLFNQGLIQNGVTTNSVQLLPRGIDAFNGASLRSLFGN